MVGSSIRLNAGTFTVVGVAPEGFHGSWRGVRVDAWVPLEASALLGANGNFLTERSARGLLLLGRLRPDVSLEQARARFAVVANQLLAQYPESWRDVNARGRTITVLPEDESRVPPDLRGAVVGIAALLLTGVALVLLICCANVANLLLARGTARAKEIAIRLSLGAGRGRLVRQLMAESVLLAALGCGGAILIAFAAADLLLRFQAPALPVPVMIEARRRLARARLRAVGRGRRGGSRSGLRRRCLPRRLTTVVALKEGAGTLAPARGSGCAAR